MTHIITSISRFTLIILIALYTYECFAALRRNLSEDESRGAIAAQATYIYLFILNANAVLYLNMEDVRVLALGGCEILLVTLCRILYNKLYTNANPTVTNNLCMLLSIGLVMLERLDMGVAIKQIVFATAALVITVFVPMMIEKLEFLSSLSYLYALVGIMLLAAVLVMGKVVYGAKLNLKLGPVTLQPSEFVKLLFVFFISSSLYKKTDRKSIFITSLIAAVHVLILVASKDLGSAMIFFVTYLFMIYVATRKMSYLGLGLGFGVVACIAGYTLFSHVRVRVLAWQDPLSVVNDAGYQVSRSLFAIGSGGWFGSGLCEGMPEKIPVVSTDFIFAAISEEMGGIFALCLIFICMSCLIMFFNISLQIREQFYKLIALGLSVCYGIQVFTTIGGVTKFIPSTGVTLPLVSYGGSSIVSTMFLFAVIQGLYKRGKRELEDEEE